MKRIILSCAVVASALAFAVNSNAGAAPNNEGYKYTANDTIPKKDTVKKDTTSGLYSSAFNYSLHDTIPQKDTVKKDTTHAMAFVR